jgi:hypothetical protein
MLTATSSAATFAHWQPRYAKQGIPIFPVRLADGVKKPAVKGYTRIGSNRSAQLVFKFADAQAFGFMCGPTSKITIGDVDAPGEVPLYAALEMWGDTPVIIRTASGKHHLYYRHSGEGRHVRFLGPDKPYDVLGGGLAVACPSQGPTGRYEFIRGGFDDLHRLPVMRQFTPANQNKAPDQTPDWAEMVEHDGRNDALFRYVMAEAHGKTLREIATIAHDRNASCGEPMTEADVDSIVKSVWVNYESQERNFVGRGLTTQLPTNAIKQFYAERKIDAITLLAVLKAHHWGDKPFVLARSMAEALGWGKSRFYEARKALEAGGYIVCIHRGGKGPNDPPRYRVAKVSPTATNK